MQRGCLDLVLKRRRGFVKVALEAGAELVPVIAFGARWVCAWCAVRDLAAMVVAVAGAGLQPLQLPGRGVPALNSSQGPTTPAFACHAHLATCPCRRIPACSTQAGENDQFNRMDLRPGSLLDLVQKTFKKVKRPCAADWFACRASSECHGDRGHCLNGLLF